MNNKDLLNSNRFVPAFDSSRFNPNQKKTGNVGFYNNTFNSAPNGRTDNVGLNNSIRHNTFINDSVHVVVDSRNRNKAEYPLPNNYFIGLNRVFTNIKEIRLEDISINGMIPSLTTYSNRLIWEYPTTGDTATIEPFAPIGELTDNKVILSGVLNEGFYSVSGLKVEFEDCLRGVLHEAEFVNGMVGSAHHFDVNVDTRGHLVYIVNRLEEYRIVAIQVLVDDGQDVFAGYSDGGGADLSCPTGFYIVVEGQFGDDNGFPLVITDYGNENNGRLPVDVNYTLFWRAGLTIMGVSEYMYVDTLTIGGRMFYRYKMTMGDSGRVYTENVNVVYSRDVQSVLENGGIAGWMSGVGMGVGGIIGRALPFRMVYKRSQIDEDICQLEPLNVDGSINTVLSVLGWNVENDVIGGVDPCYVPLLIGEEQGPTELPYRYVHINVESFGEEEVGYSALMEPGALPPRLLNIENVDGEHWFRSDDYIFLRLVFEEDQSEIGTQIIQAGAVNAGVDDNDVSLYYYNVGCGVNPGQRLQRKGLDNIFAKIDLTVLPGNNINSVESFISNELNFKNEQMTRLERVGVQFLDREGRLLNMRGNHHFTLLFISKRNTLENILMNTRNG